MCIYIYIHIHTSAANMCVFLELKIAVIAALAVIAVIAIMMY